MDFAKELGGAAAKQARLGCLVKFIQGQDWEQLCETVATVTFDENNDLNVDHEGENVHETCAQP